MGLGEISFGSKFQEVLEILDEKKNSEKSGFYSPILNSNEEHKWRTLS